MAALLDESMKRAARSQRKSEVPLLPLLVSAQRKFKFISPIKVHLPWHLGNYRVLSIIYL